MAVTKILPVRSRLERAIEYVSNPQKTSLEQEFDYATNGEKTQEMLYCDTINCRSLETAVGEMKRTKDQFGKTGGVQAYHIIQSFAPGEANLTPDMVHEIGMQFAQQCFGNQYQVVVATHLDRAHLHNHILVNSVGCFDGRKYHSNSQSYYNQLRKTSDELCKQHGLSIVKPEGKGEHYGAIKEAGDDPSSMRSMIRADVDVAKQNSYSWETMVIELRRMGYTVRYGPNIKYATLKHREGKRGLRFKSLGEGYSETELKVYFEEKQHSPAGTSKGNPVSTPAQKTYRRSCGKARMKGRLLPAPKITGFMALYYRYVYLLGKAKKKRVSRRCYYVLREDFARFERYKNQTQFIWQNHIETVEQLQELRQQIDTQMDVLVQKRKPIHLKLREAEGAEKEELTRQRIELTQALRELRRSRNMCDAIAESAEEIRQRTQMVTKIQQQENQKERKRLRDEQRR